MLKILLSCDASNRNHLDLKYKLLKECVQGEYPIGIEIFEYWNRAFDPQLIKSIKNNLADLLEDIDLSFHAPFTNRIGNWKQNYFSSKEGFNNLIKAFDAAESLGANTVNLHTSFLHSYDELKKINEGNLEEYRQGLINNVADTLDIIRDSYSQKICIESMPYDWAQETARDPAEMIYDICFVEIKDFLKVVNPRKNIFATIDTAHSASFYDSSEMLQEIKRLEGGLGHAHLSDLGGIWKPFISLSREGLIPGNGRIGERVFRELLGYFFRFSEKQDLGIVIETRDASYLELRETRESLNRIMKWLDEAKKYKVTHCATSLL
ncbi:MAG: sugar phosphate isomerase/epimerase [Patescibacteria group bacterium]